MEVIFINNLLFLLKSTFYNIVEIYREKNEENTSIEINYTVFDMFLEEIKADYRNSSPQLRVALDKFAE